MCKEGLDIYENQCKGMTTFKDSKIVVVDKDSCFNGCYKILHRKTRTFPDESCLFFDDVLICADKNLLLDIANTIKKEFD